jgi:hypothetical protein
MSDECIDMPYIYVFAFSEPGQSFVAKALSMSTLSGFKGKVRILAMHALGFECTGAVGLKYAFGFT